MGPAVSEKKLIKEGTWETCKEILGWLINGINQTIKLPMGKCESLIKELNETTNFSRKHKKYYIPLKQFQKIHGRLQFASMAMAIGKPLLGPLDCGLAVAAKSNTDEVVLTESIYHCLKELQYIIKLINAKPTFCKQLILHPTAYQGFVDASG